MLPVSFSIRGLISLGIKACVGKTNLCKLCLRFKDEDALNRMAIEIYSNHKTDSHGRERRHLTNLDEMAEAQEVEGVIY